MKPRKKMKYSSQLKLNHLDSELPDLPEHHHTYTVLNDAGRTALFCDHFDALQVQRIAIALLFCKTKKPVLFLQLLFWDLLRIASFAGPYEEWRPRQLGYRRSSRFETSVPDVPPLWSFRRSFKAKAMMQQLRDIRGLGGLTMPRHLTRFRYLFLAQDLCIMLNCYAQGMGSAGYAAIAFCHTDGIAPPKGCTFTTVIAQKCRARTIVRHGIFTNYDVVQDGSSCMYQDGSNHWDFFARYRDAQGDYLYSVDNFVLCATDDYRFDFLLCSVDLKLLELHVKRRASLCFDDFYDYDIVCWNNTFVLRTTKNGSFVLF